VWGVGEEGEEEEEEEGGEEVNVQVVVLVGSFVPVR